MRRSAPIVLVLVSACIQPLRLARDDSPTVLSQTSLVAPNPGEKGNFTVARLYYGSGTDKQRKEYHDSVTLKTESVNGAKLVSSPQDKSRKKY